MPISWSKTLKNDILCWSILFLFAALFAVFNWGHFCDPLSDQSWAMQVAARMANGEILYRDILWAYGPLPVYVLALLFRLFQIGLTSPMILSYILALLGCLLSFRLARFLLPRPLALLGTLALFCSDWDWSRGGFISYAQAFILAAPMGSVLGLVFVLGLIHYLKNGKSYWLLISATACGGTFLCKPEFALASAGTGLLILGFGALWPSTLGTQRRVAIRALAIFFLVSAAVTAASYGFLASRAGWGNILAGVSGYGQIKLLFNRQPLLGSAIAWRFILKGLGIYVLLAIIIAIVHLPKKMAPLKIILAALIGGTLLSLIIFRWKGRINHLHLWRFFSSWRIWAPATFLLLILLVILAARWLWAKRSRERVSPEELILAVLTLYSSLAAARFFFNPNVTTLPYYLDTYFPILLYLLAILWPRKLAGWFKNEPRRPRVQIMISLLLALYSCCGGFELFRFQQSRWQLELRTPRGKLLLLPPTGPYPWYWPKIHTLRFLIDHTRPGETIAIFGSDPGLYFLSACRNPLSFDRMLPDVGNSPAMASDTLQRLKNARAKLVLIQGWRKPFAWLPILPGGQSNQPNFIPIWKFIRDHYRLETFFNEQGWGYAIFVLKESD